jgi:hypothetical protein
MTGREHLEKVNELGARLNSKLKDLQTFRELITNPCGKLSSMPRSPSPNKQLLESLMAKIVDLEKEVNEAVDEYIDYKQEVSDSLRRIGDPYGKVLELRYLRRMKWSDVSAELGYERRYLCRLQVEGLRQLESLLTDTR